MTAEFSSVEEYKLLPCFNSLQCDRQNEYTTVQCKFWENNRESVSVCLRTNLQCIAEKVKLNSIKFLVRFKIEIVFMR